MAEKVKIINNSNRSITISDDSLRFSLSFEKRNVVRYVDFDILQQIIYNPGTEYIFRHGLLTIEDMKVKIALGLEPEEATEPVNIIVLTEAQQRRHLTVSPMNEFVEVVNKLSKEQLEELISFAATNSLIGNMEKIDYLQKKTGIDIIKKVQLAREEKFAN